MKYLYFIFNILLIMALVSCQPKVNDETPTENNLIEISKAQFEAENMELGSVQKAAIKQTVAFTGKIVPLNDGIAKISVPIPGKILSVEVRDGEYVAANKTLIKLGGNEVIDLQMEFAASSAKLNQLRSDYEKAKQLFDENIRTETEFLLAESNYKVELANHSALKVKLQNIGLNLSHIQKGEYASYYRIKAPISGKVSELKVVRGQYVNTDTEIMEITDNNKVELHLTLFEKDLPKIEVGQEVQFRGIENNTSLSMATISRIGGKLNTGSNTIDCFASIGQRKNTYAHNQMVNGSIIIASDTVTAVPQTAVFTIGENHYVLVRRSEDSNSYWMEKKKISIGKTSDNFVELLNKMEDEILIRGTYHINPE